MKEGFVSSNPVKDGPSNWVKVALICCLLFKCLHGTDVGYFLGCSFAQTIAISKPRPRTFHLGGCLFCVATVFGKTSSSQFDFLRLLFCLLCLHPPHSQFV